MNTHTLNVAEEPYNKIESGEKVIESRLFDEKRQAINIGDHLVFINRENNDRKLEVEVIGLLRYQNFYDLFSNQDYHKFGGPSVYWLEKQINEFYSKEEQKKYGVLGIEFEVLD